jgi:hypothetical protein
MSKPAAIVQIEREIAEKKAAEKAAHDAEIKRITDEHDARMRAEAAARKRREDAAQAERDKRFDDELEADARRMFLDGNPGASEALWKSVREEYRRLVMRRRAEAAAAQSHPLYRW